MFDVLVADEVAQIDQTNHVDHVTSLSKWFNAAKNFFDIVVSLLLLPLLAFFALVLFCVNPFLNSGRLFFMQKRMGRNCEAFTAFKFRSMREIEEIERSADCPLEVDRITLLGKFMRKTRIDELPQILNVLGGEMSLIGPRPDFFEHAVHYMKEIPGYRERHFVRPGISGFAQTEVGYVAGVEATRKKVNADLFYIANSGFRLEAWIIWRTFAVILGRRGA